MFVCNEGRQDNVYFLAKQHLLHNMNFLLELGKATDLRLIALKVASEKKVSAKQEGERKMA